MVAIVSGKGLGLENSSAFVLGSLGQVGSATLGRSGEQVYVNAATGNLVITRQDEFLIGRGPDISIDRTYNSLGDLSDDNGDNWKMGVYRKVYGLSGTYGATGTTVKRIDWDGSEQIYTWNATESAYITTDGAGAYDKLTRASGTWTWTDGATQICESYDDGNGGRITRRYDPDHTNQTYGVTYNYNGSGLITRVTNLNGANTDDYTDLVYSGTLLQKIETHAGGTTTRVFYTYDGYNRLSQVRVNLNPGDNTDGPTGNYVTTYAYVDTSSRRIASITQTDGSVLTIGYTLLSGIYKVTSLTQTVASGVTRTTNITYSASTMTMLADDSGNKTYVNFSSGTNNLYSIVDPDNTDSPRAVRLFNSSSNGNYNYTATGSSEAVNLQHDSHGNVILEIDVHGNTIKRTYSSKNELLRETRYTTPDSDNIYGQNQASGAMTTRYAYDANGHLRYMVNPEGEVTEYVTETNAANLGFGQRIATIQYASNTFNLSSYAEGDAIAVGTLDTWVSGISDKSGAARTQFEYDYRGNLTATKSYSKLLASGAFDTGSELSHTTYVYDPAGNLLTRQTNGAPTTETFVYDGLNRMISSVEANRANSSTSTINVSTTIAFNDATQSTVVNLANGLVKTSTYNLAGELISYSESGSGVTTATTQYKYDNLGRLRIKVDALGQRDFFFYDAAGQKIGEVDSDGTVTRLRYDERGLITSTTTYKTRLTGTQLASLVNGSGNPTGVTLSSITPSDHSDDRWTWNLYDGARRLIRTIDGSGATQTFTYDGASRLVASRQYGIKITPSEISQLKSFPASIHYNIYASGNYYDDWRTQYATQTSAAPIDGYNAVKFTAMYEYYPAKITFADEVSNNGLALTTYSITVKAVGSATSHEFGLLNLEAEEPEWEWSGDSTAVILSGPGTLEQIDGRLYRISGLSTTQATRIQIKAMQSPYEVLDARFYITSHDPYGEDVPINGDAVILSNAVLTSSAYFPPELPEEDYTDRVTRNFYDADGRLIGTLDGEGGLIEIVYDEAGRKTQVIAHATRPSPMLWASGTFAQLLNSSPRHVAGDERDYFVYDARGFLRATVNGEGDLTRYHYTPLGDVDEVVTGQKLNPSTLATTPPTFANLPAVPGGTILQTTSYTRNLHGDVLTETRSLTGSTTTTTAYAYDNMRRVVKTTTQSGGPDPRAETRRYDLRGRLTGTLYGIGSAQLAALGGSPTQPQIDAVWANYGTAYTYDAGDRLISSIDPNNNRTLFYYDADDRLAIQVNALGETVEYRYNAFGERSDVIVYGQQINSGTLPGMTGGAITAGVTSILTTLASAAVDQATHADFDVTGRMSQSIDALSNATIFAYDAFGEMVSKTVPFGTSSSIQTTYEYDRRGLFFRETVDAPNLALTSDFYADVFGNIVETRKGEMTTGYLNYDRAGRLIWTADANENSVSKFLDARGNVVLEYDALNATRYVYDKGGRRIATIDAAGAVTTATYDADGRVVATRSYYNTLDVGTLPYEVTEATLSLPTVSTADRVTRYSYDKDGRLRFTIDGLMHVTENIYDDNGNVIRAIAYNGTIGTDGSGGYSEAWIASQVSALAANGGNRIARFTYDAANRLVFSVNSLTGTLGQVTQLVYDTKGQVIKKIEYAAAVGSTADFSVGDFNTWVGTHANATNDRVTRTYYDKKGRLAYSIDALGFVTRFEYDKADHVTKQSRYPAIYSATDSTTLANLNSAFASPPTGTRTTSHTYDSAGRLFETTDAESYVTRYELDEKSRICSVTTAYGTSAASTIAYAYDVVDRVVFETRGYGTAAASTTYFEYDALNRVENRIDANNTDEETITHFTYDEIGRVTSVVQGYTSLHAVETLTEYDAYGRVIETTDARGSVISNDYDVLDRLTSRNEQMEDATSSDDRITGYSYNNFGEVTKVHDARGNDSFAYYDTLGRVVREVDAEKYVTDRTYTRGGQVDTVKRWAKVTGQAVLSETVVPSDPPADAGDAVTHFTYNKRDELRIVQDAEGHSEEYVLNAFGERERLINKLGGWTDYTYDRVGNLKTELVYRAVYDSSGTQIASSVRTDLTYDARHNLKTRTEGANLPSGARLTTYTYDALDRVTTINRPDALSLTVGLYMDEMLLSMEDHFTYDRRGNVIVAEVAGEPKRYSYYDVLGRKTSEVDATGALTVWTYDENGNVETRRGYGDAVTFPSSRGASPPTPVDANNYRETSYVYDRSNRLISTSTRAVWTWNGPGSAFVNQAITHVMGYDAGGNVIREAIGSVEARSFYDKTNRKIGQLDAEGYLTVLERDAADNVLKETRYALPPAGTLGQLTTVADLKAAATIDSDNDRITVFEYDHVGNRTSETRLNVQAWTLGSGGSLLVDNLPEHHDARIRYEYNGFGQVVRKIMANSDTTDLDYDAQGQLRTVTAQSFTDYLGNVVHPTTRNFYDGFGETVRVTVNDAAGAASADHITTYSYDLLGRMNSMSQEVATGSSITHFYWYDAGGRVVMDRYGRNRNGQSTITEAVCSVYDAAGRLTRQTVATRGTATPPALPKWSFGDWVNQRYNVFGELTGRGLNTNADVTPAYQEVFEYDVTGRVWRTNSGDGVAKIMAYDERGNATLTLSSAGANLGTTDFVTAKNSINALGDGGTNIDGAVASISRFDKRNQEIATLLPDRQTGYNEGTSSYVIADLALSRTYNAFGEVSSETDARNNMTNFSYNGMGRLIRKESPLVAWTNEHGTVANAHPVEKYYYDVAGRLIGTEDANTRQTRHALLAGTGHDGSEALVSIDYHADNARAKTLYDVFGNARIQRNEYYLDFAPNTTDPNDYTKTDVLFDYDKLGRTTQVKHLGRQVFDLFTYDTLGQQLTHTLDRQDGGTDLTETTDYDRQGRVTKQVEFGGDITSYSYGWGLGLATSGLGTFGGWVKTTTYVGIQVNGVDIDATETTDYFGRVTDRSDFGDHHYTYTFDLAGRTASTAIGSLTQTNLYFNTGLRRQTGTGSGDWAAYDYDASGNLLAETVTRGGTLVQNASATYDALNRMQSWAEAGTTKLLAASIAWEYDLVGNVRRKNAAFTRVNGFGAALVGNTQDNWYLYDSMNRVTTDRGRLISINGVNEIRRQVPAIVLSQLHIGEVGADYAYDVTGKRVSMALTKVSFTGGPPAPNANYREQKEMYDYDAAGNLIQTRLAVGATVPFYETLPGAGNTGNVQSTFTYDALGRVTGQTDWVGSQQNYSRYGIVYNDKGQITDEHTSTLRDNNTVYVTNVVNNYGIGNAYARGAVVQSTSTNTLNSNADSTIVTANTYAWRDASISQSINIVTTGGSSSNYTTTNSYDDFGQLTSASIQDGSARTATFTNDLSGQVIRRDITQASNAAPHELWYRFGDKQLGFVGNNGTIDTDYDQSMTNRQIVIGTTGTFRYGSTNPTSYVDFSQSVSPINSFDQGSAGGSYTVREGDTLQSIATNLWGTPDLWYTIAEENGLSAGSPLTAGRTLRLPVGVVSNVNNASSFRPYDPNAAIGDISPTTPMPPKKPGGCGMLGQLLIIAIAVAITLVLKVPVANLIQFGATAVPAGVIGGAGIGASIAGGAIAGAVGSVVSQGVGVATGIQDKFSWKGVALSAIGGGISGGLGKFAQLSSLPNNPLFQGVRIGGALGKIGQFLGGTGLVNGAVNGVASNLVGQGIGLATGLQKKFDWLGVATAGVGGAVGGQIDRWTEGSNLSPTLARGLSRAGSAVATSGLRSLATGTSFGDNLISALPDVVGTTIGNFIVDRVSSAIEAARLRAEKRDAAIIARKMESVDESDVTSDAVQLRNSRQGMSVGPGGQPVPEPPETAFAPGTSLPGVISPRDFILAMTRDAQREVGRSQTLTSQIEFLRTNDIPGHPGLRLMLRISDDTPNGQYNSRTGEINIPPSLLSAPTEKLIAVLAHEIYHAYRGIDIRVSALANNLVSTTPNLDPQGAYTGILREEEARAYWNSMTVLNEIYGRVESGILPEETDSRWRGLFRDVERGRQTVDGAIQLMMPDIDRIVVTSGNDTYSSRWARGYETMRVGVNSEIEKQIVDQREDDDEAYLQERGVNPNLTRQQYESSPAYIDAHRTPFAPRIREWVPPPPRPRR